MICENKSSGKCFEKAGAFKCIMNTPYPHSGSIRIPLPPEVEIKWRKKWIESREMTIEHGKTQTIDTLINEEALLYSLNISEKT